MKQMLQGPATQRLSCRKWKEIAFPFLNGNIENNLRIPQHSLVGDLLLIQEIGINTKFGLNFLTLGFLKVAYAEKEMNLVALQ